MKAILFYEFNLSIRLFRRVRRLWTTGFSPATSDSPLLRHQVVELLGF